jgi:hypothetical protein
MFKKLALGFFAAFLATFLLCQYVNAQTTDAAPFAGKCFNEAQSICLVPALSFNVGTVALSGPDAGKFSAGAVPVGAGYSLQFAYDQWYAFGPAVHAIVDLSQANANFVQLAGMFNFARYVHAGVVWAMLGSERTWYAAAGLTLPIDLVTTAVADKRAKAVRAYRATQPPKSE